MPSSHPWAGAGSNDVRSLSVLLVAISFLGVACGEGPGGRDGRSATPTPTTSSLPKDQLYEGTGLVLDEASGKGPIFCVGGIEESAPPQCGGPIIRGWSW